MLHNKTSVVSDNIDKNFLFLKKAGLKPAYLQHITALFRGSVIYFTLGVGVYSVFFNLQDLISSFYRKIYKFCDGTASMELPYI